MIKVILTAAVLSVVLTYGCGGGNAEKNQDGTAEKSVIGQMTESAGALKELSKLEQYGKDIEQRMNVLKALTPVSNEVLKAVLPETLVDMKRKSLRVGEMSAMGVASASAEYENADDTKSLDINIIDGAGESGSGMASLMFFGFTTEREEITENGFEKTTEINGKRALVKEETDNGEVDSEIKWIHDERFIIELKADGYTLDELTQLFKNLDLSALK